MTGMGVTALIARVNAVVGTAMSTAGARATGATTGVNMAAVKVEAKAGGAATTERNGLSPLQAQDLHAQGAPAGPLGLGGQGMSIW